MLIIMLWYFSRISHGKDVQCRGKNNCSMTEEVKEFTEIFEKEMIVYEKSLDKNKGRKGKIKWHTENMETEKQLLMV